MTAFALLFFLAAPRLTYWIDPAAGEDAELAQWAMQAWSEASGGAFQFERLPDRAHARIRIIWADKAQGRYGEARPVLIDGRPGAEVFVRPSPLRSGDKLMRDAILYLTCLHETGHALGLEHTNDYLDIMYSFQYGGDIPAYFDRYRRQLRTRADIRTHSGLSAGDRAHLRALESAMLK